MGRRGPKAKAGKREAAGRLSRQIDDVLERRNTDLDAEERETLREPLLARARVYKLAPIVIRDQMVNSAVGRMCIQGLVTRVQYDAATEYLKDCEAYSRAMSSPRQPGAVDLNAVHGRPVGNEDELRSIAIVARMRAARAAVQDKQNEIKLHANLWGALDLILHRDVQLHHLAGDLRYALNALAKHYGMEGR